MDNMDNANHIVDLLCASVACNEIANEVYHGIANDDATTRYLAERAFMLCDFRTSDERGPISHTGTSHIAAWLTDATNDHEFAQQMKEVAQQLETVGDQLRSVNTWPQMIEALRLIERARTYERIVETLTAMMTLTIGFRVQDEHIRLYNFLDDELSRLIVAAGEKVSLPDGQRFVMMRFMRHCTTRSFELYDEASETLASQFDGQ